ncbi:Muconolactone Delta-isomerase [Corynebacterium atrinae]|uniref:muconolactone Delta-isomerase n=1 Tax=Corynebacterium atrinae TaxID=1336740 RepID=UPI0025B4CFB6|nr:muconolactone Delta-isomerase [Corynebacterium atrinae]WJY63103.1 Muconolactone Delta-isomerase [Corynebacterium atrinae]
MLFIARMDVSFPDNLTPEQVADFQAREKEYSGNLQAKGTMKGIWRVVGKYSNYSIYDVASNDELQEVLSGFPMYKYMNIEVTPLAQHPNATRDFFV